MTLPRYPPLAISSWSTWTLTRWARALCWTPRLYCLLVSDRVNKIYGLIRQPVVSFVGWERAWHSTSFVLTGGMKSQDYSFFFISFAASCVWDHLTRSVRYPGDDNARGRACQGNSNESLAARKGSLRYLFLCNHLPNASVEAGLWGMLSRLRKFYSNQYYDPSARKRNLASYVFFGSQGDLSATRAGDATRRTRACKCLRHSWELSEKILFIVSSGISHEQAQTIIT